MNRGKNFGCLKCVDATDVFLVRAQCLAGREDANLIYKHHAGNNSSSYVGQNVDSLRSGDRSYV